MMMTINVSWNDRVSVTTLHPRPMKSREIYQLPRIEQTISSGIALTYWYWCVPNWNANSIGDALVGAHSEKQVYTHCWCMSTYPASSLPKYLWAFTFRGVDHDGTSNCMTPRSADRWIVVLAIRDRDVRIEPSRALLQSGPQNTVPRVRVVKAILWWDHWRDSSLEGCRSEHVLLT